MNWYFLSLTSCQKVWQKNVTMVGFIIYAIGSAICWIMHNNLVVVLIGQFIKNIGGLPCAYVFTGIACDLILFFVNIEKTISKKHEVLVQREKLQYAKEGKEWLPADERNAIELKNKKKQKKFINKLKFKGLLSTFYKQ